MKCEWRPIPGYEGLYEASNEGQVRRVQRRALIGDGTRTRLLKQQVLKPHLNKDGYEAVGLWQNGRPKVFFNHRLVLETFIGPMPEGKITRHLDGNCRNNRLSNLAYGTLSENQHDRVRHGRNEQANQTECHRGHRFDERNTYRKANGQRSCRACNVIAVAEYKARKRKAAS